MLLPLFFERARAQKSKPQNGKGHKICTRVKDDDPPTHQSTQGCDAHTATLCSPTKLIGKSPSGKANRRPCTNVKKGSCQERNPCDYWHAPECTKFRAPGKCRFGDKWAHKHTSKPSDEKKNSPLIAIHNPSDDERQVQLRKIQSNDTTQYRVRLHHGNKYVLKTYNLATCTWSHPDWISKDAKSKIFNIRGRIYRMEFEHGRKYKESSADF